MVEIDALPQTEIKEGFKVRFVHTENLTLGKWDVGGKHKKNNLNNNDDVLKDYSIDKPWR